MRTSSCKQLIVFLLTDHCGMTIREIVERTGFNYQAVGRVVRYDADFVVVPQRPDPDHPTVGHPAKVYALAPCHEALPHKQRFPPPPSPHEQLVQEQMALAQAIRALNRRKTDEGDAQKKDEYNRLIQSLFAVWKDGDEEIRALIILLIGDSGSQSH